MGIVVITIDGDVKRQFVNTLHRKTNNGVDLVIIARPIVRSKFERLKRMYSIVGFSKLPRQLWYSLLLRLSRKTKNILEYFRIHTRKPDLEKSWLPKTMKVTDVNSSEVEELLRKLGPDLLVVWGSTILKPNILATAPKTINLHMGFCPFYRGAVANQFAAYQDDYEKIGATIHYINGIIDGGEILAQVTANPEKALEELFRDLNDRARETFILVAERLYRGEEVPTTSQDLSLGKHYMLKHWTPEVRYKLGKKLLKREEKSKA